MENEKMQRYYALHRAKVALKTAYNCVDHAVDTLGEYFGEEDKEVREILYYLSEMMLNLVVLGKKLSMLQEAEENG